MQRPARPLLYLGTLMVASVPFQALALATQGRPGPLGLPVSVVFIVVPAAAATAFAWRENGRRGARDLWRQLGERPRSAAPWAFALAFPTLTLGVDLLIRAALGWPSPTWTTPVEQAPTLLALYLGGAVLEEIGWTGYATPALLRRWGVVPTGLTIGVAWSAIHWGSWAAMGRGPGEIAMLTAGTVLLRQVMTCVYATGPGGLGSAVLLHAASNTAQTYPDGLAAVDVHVWALAVGATAALSAIAAAVLRKVVGKSQ